MIGIFVSCTSWHG